VNTIQEGSFLTLHYRLTGPDGDDVVNTFGGRPATLSIGSGQLAPALERHLIGLVEGAHQRFTLDAGEAFGPHSPERLQRVSRELVDRVAERDAPFDPGTVVRFPTPDGTGTYSGVVRELGQDWLLFDFNHPLAGQPVGFEVQVIGVL